jgi:hypothetical protein
MPNNLDNGVPYFSFLFGSARPHDGATVEVQALGYCLSLVLSKPGEAKQWRD